MKTRFAKLRPNENSEPFPQEANTSVETSTADRRAKATKAVEDPKTKTFIIGETVLVRDYSVSGSRWQPAVVNRTRGRNMYECQTDRGLWTRHTNQMMKCDQRQSRELVNMIDRASEANFSCTFHRVDQTNPFGRVAPVQVNEEQRSPPRDESVAPEPSNLVIEETTVREETNAGERPSTSVDTSAIEGPSVSGQATAGTSRAEANENQLNSSFESARGNSSAEIDTESEDVAEASVASAREPEVKPQPVTHRRISSREHKQPDWFKSS